MLFPAARKVYTHGVSGFSNLESFVPSRLIEFIAAISHARVGSQVAPCPS